MNEEKNSHFNKNLSFLCITYTIGQNFDLIEIDLIYYEATYAKGKETNISGFD